VSSGGLERAIALNAGVVAAIIILCIGLASVLLIRHREAQPGSAVWKRDKTPVAAAAWTLDRELTGLGHTITWTPLGEVAETVQAICARCGGSLELAGTPEGGYTVLAVLPLAGPDGPVECPGER
jgi:hypothetical protein